MFVLTLTQSGYLTTDFNAWYGQSSLFVVVVLLALAAWGFKISLGGQAPSKLQPAQGT